MRDLKANEWAGAAVDLRRLGYNPDDKLQTPSLKPVAETFLATKEHLALLAHFPKFLFSLGRNFQQAHIFANIQCTGNPFNQPATSELAEKIADLRNRVLEGDISEAPTPILEDTITNTYKETGDALEQWFSRLMAVQLVSIWTMIETFTGDVWEAAVNVHPRGLSELRGKTKYKTPDEKSGAVLSVIRLQEYNFDVSRAMGTLLMKEEKVSFTSLENIQNAYERAFFEHSDNIMAALNHPAVDALSTARNLIAHKSGICDEEYVKRVKYGKLTQLPTLRPGEKLELDGAILKEVLVPACECAVKLIKSVDGWLLGHPERARRVEAGAANQ